MAGSWYVRAGRRDAARYSRRIEASSAAVRIPLSATLALRCRARAARPESWGIRLAGTVRVASDGPVVPSSATMHDATSAQALLQGHPFVPVRDVRGQPKCPDPGLQGDLRFGVAVDEEHLAWVA